mgnify:CR=1 FL=1
MHNDIGFQQALDMVSKWDEYHRQEFYQLFPETVQQETRYDLMGLQQHDEDEGFAKDLEGEEFNEKEIDRATQESLETQLATLSATAGKEAASAQNLTVYNHAMTIWNKAEDTGELLEYLEAYAEERTEWNERDQLESNRKPLQEPRLQYGDSEDAEYVEEILTQLVTETMHEV